MAEFEDAAKSLLELHRQEVSSYKDEIAELNEKLKLSENQLTIARKDNAKLVRKLEEAKVKIMGKKQETKWLRDVLLKNDITINLDISTKDTTHEDMLTNSTHSSNLVSYSPTTGADSTVTSTKDQMMTRSGSRHDSFMKETETVGVACQMNPLESKNENDKSVVNDNSHFALELEEHIEDNENDDLTRLDPIVGGATNYNVGVVKNDNSDDSSDDSSDGCISPSILNASFSNDHTYTKSPPIININDDCNTTEVKRKRMKRKTLQTTLTQVLSVSGEDNIEADNNNDDISPPPINNVIPPTPWVGGKSNFSSSWQKDLIDENNENLLDMTHAIHENREKHNVSSNAKKKPKFDNLIHAQELAKKAGLPQYSHVTVIRRKEDRAKLDGKACPDCEKWYKYNGNYRNQREHLKHTCKHKKLFHPPDSDPSIWNISFPQDSSN